jgi:hypothetical protein
MRRWIARRLKACVYPALVNVGKTGAVEQHRRRRQPVVNLLVVIHRLLFEGPPSSADRPHDLLDKICHSKPPATLLHHLTCPL